MGVTEVRGLKQLEDSNAKMKRLVAALIFDRVILQDVLQKEPGARPGPEGGRVHAKLTGGLPLESRTPPVGRIAPARRSVFHVHDASLYP